jgi:hypothetical protein
MKLNNKTLLLYITVLFFISCVEKEDQQKLADIRLNKIEQLIRQNSYNQAKIQIDSIHLLFPRLVKKRAVAQAYADTIARRENSRSLIYCDSMLVIKQKEKAEIQMNFRFEKDKKYQDVGSYVYKSQITENNATRTYLKAYVDENSDFFLVSNYCGNSKLEHISVKVSVDDVFSQTDTIPVSNAFNHSFVDGAVHWESLTFKNEADKGVSAFIAQYETKQIHVSLIGKRPCQYILCPSDKKAISQAYQLWVVMKDVEKLENEIKKASSKISRLKK